MGAGISHQPEQLKRRSTLTKLEYKIKSLKMAKSLDDKMIYHEKKGKKKRAKTKIKLVDYRLDHREEHESEYHKTRRILSIPKEQRAMDPVIFKRKKCTVRRYGDPKEIKPVNAAKPLLAQPTFRVIDLPDQNQERKLTIQQKIKERQAERLQRETITAKSKQPIRQAKVETTSQEWRPEGGFSKNTSQAQCMYPFIDIDKATIHDTRDKFLQHSELFRKQSNHETALTQVNENNQDDRDNNREEVADTAGSWVQSEQKSRLTRKLEKRRLEAKLENATCNREINDNNNNSENDDTGSEDRSELGEFSSAMDNTDTERIRARMARIDTCLLILNQSSEKWQALMRSKDRTKRPSIQKFERRILRPLFDEMIHLEHLESYGILRKIAETGVEPFLDVYLKMVKERREKIEIDKCRRSKDLILLNFLSVTNVSSKTGHDMLTECGWDTTLALKMARRKKIQGEDENSNPETTQDMTISNMEAICNAVKEHNIRLVRNVIHKCNPREIMLGLGTAINMGELDQAIFLLLLEACDHQTARKVILLASAKGNQFALRLILRSKKTMLTEDALGAAMVLAATRGVESSVQLLCTNVNKHARDKSLIAAVAGDHPNITQRLLGLTTTDSRLRAFGIAKAGSICQRILIAWAQIEAMRDTRLRECAAVRELEESGEESEEEEDVADCKEPNTPNTEQQVLPENSIETEQSNDEEDDENNVNNKGAGEDTTDEGSSADHSSTQDEHQDETNVIEEPVPEPTIRFEAQCRDYFAIERMLGWLLCVHGISFEGRKVVDLSSGRGDALLAAFMSQRFKIAVGYEEDEDLCEFACRVYSRHQSDMQDVFVDDETSSDESEDGNNDEDNEKKRGTREVVFENINFTETETWSEDADLILATTCKYPNDKQQLEQIKDRAVLAFFMPNQECIDYVSNSPQFHFLGNLHDHGEAGVHLWALFQRKH